MTESSALDRLRGRWTMGTREPDGAVAIDAVWRTAVVVMATLLVTSVFTGTVAFAGTAAAAEGDIGFSPSTLDLGGADLDNPTALQFGPDGRLYVAERFGDIHVFEVTRNGANDYDVVSAATITTVANLPNHDDQGTYQSGVDGREVTGIVVAGSAENPVLFVSSSDPRVGGGSNNKRGDTDLDTNSGVISKLTLNDQGEWEHVMLVRGLPRSEENHASNGMALSADGETLYVAQGGNTNKGAPATNFAYAPEYALSAAILEIDLAQLAAMDQQDATHTDVPYLYDLPTLNETDTPFGGQDGANMAKLVADGPVQIYAPGYRNPYDVVLTEDDQLYTVDNGPNKGWGDVPDGEGTAQCTNQIQEQGDTLNDQLHLVEAGDYGGHPNPTRGNPDGAGLYDENGQKIGSVADAVYDGYDGSRECTYLDSNEDDSLATFNPSTNGITEYTASNFGGAMQGDLLTAGYNGKIFRVQLNDAGTEATDVTTIFSGFGNKPLDVTAQGDSGPFPGTVWVADIAGNTITVFEPNDSGGDPPQCDASDPAGDADGDGYTNGDEKDVGTDPCSAGSQPEDYDDDKISNLNDPDDDNDGLSDTEDPFAVDPDNGLSTTLPVEYDFNSSEGIYPSLEGIGFTGLMANGQNYQSLYEPNNVIFGGANPSLTVESVKDGDAVNNVNTQKHAFQFGIDPLNEPFTVSTTVNGLPENPEKYQSLGIYIGTGDQDNYQKLVASSVGDIGGVQFGTEINGQFTSSTTPGPSATAISRGSGDHRMAGSMVVEPAVQEPGTATELFLTVYPNTNTVEAFYATDGGEKIKVGEEQIPADWLDTADGTGLAVGVISTSYGPAEPFSATWSGISVTKTGEPAPDPDPNPDPSGGETEITILEGSNDIDDSTYGSGSFEITNTGNQNIESVTFDLSSSALPDVVFDPEGTAGDTAAKGFDPDGGASQTGLVGGEFSQPHNGQNADDGYDVLTITFDDFGPDETFSFSVDNDPTSIKGAPGTHPAGPVSGLELARSTVAVDYTDGSTQTANVFSDGSNGGSQAVVKSDPATAPSIDVAGVDLQQTTLSPDHTAATVTDAEQTVTVSGPPGATVRLLQVEGELALGDGADDGYEIEEYEANKALAVGEYPVTIGGDGTAEVPVTLTESTENGGLNHFVATVMDGAGDTGRTSNVVVLDYEPNPAGNQAPTLAPVSDQSVGTGTTLDVPVSATDPEGDAIALSASGLSDFATLTDDGDGTGNLTLAPEAGDAGTYELTLTASDGELEDTQTVNVTVTRPDDEVAFAVNAGGGKYTASDGTVYEADTNFAGGDTFDTNDPISGTGDDPLYQTERFGKNFSYAVPVENGTYNVTFKFAEIYFESPDERVFNASAEGEQVITNLDIAEQAGHDTALDSTQTVTVTDGELNLGFNASVNNAKVSAILVEPAEDTSNQPPAAAFSYAPTNPTTGESVTFTDESTDADGTVENWRWEFGDGTTATAQNPTHTYTESGTYTVTLTVTDDDGATDTVTKTVTVGAANQPPTADAGTDQTVDESETVALDGTGSSDPDGETLAYEWTQTAGPSVDVQGANTATPTFTAPDVDAETTLSFNLTVSDGSTSDTDTVSVIVQPVENNAPPSASFTYSPQNPEAGEEIAFDAGESSDSDGTIASHEWDFDGDGTTDATGQQATHTYAESGQKTVTLTVTDDDGASDAVTKTVMVAAANQPPTADAGSDQTVEEGETVALSGTGSSDPEGETLTYQWTQTAGPAVSLDGANTATPTFTAPAVDAETTLSFELTVSDGSASDTDTVSVIVQPDTESPPPPTAIGETGTLTVGQPSDDTWHTVTLDNSYENPVVVMSPVTFDGPEAVHVRVRNVQSDSFEFQLEEWSYLDGAHRQETVNYVVMEAGTHTLPDGTTVRAGTVTTNLGFTGVNVGGAFEERPMVLTQAQTVNGPQPITTRQRATSDGFAVRLQEEEARGGFHRAETVGYVALEPGTGTTNGVGFEVGSTGDTVTSDGKRISFAQSAGDAPVFLARMQSFDGPNTAHLRYSNLDASGVNVVIEEERSADGEVWHQSETAGYVVFDGSGTLVATPTAIGETGTLTVGQSGPGEWHTVTLDNSYENPVVVMSPVTFDGPEAIHGRVRNVQSDSFEFQLEEWSYLDGAHRQETVHYVVMEAGTHTLADGTVVQAGTTETDLRFTSVDFAQTFEQTPVVLTQSQTERGFNQIVTRQRAVSPTGFDVRLQEEEARGGFHRAETVGYVALEPGTGTTNGVGFEVGSTGDTVTSDGKRISFAQSAGDAPVFLARMQSFDGPNTAHLRYSDLDPTGVNVVVEEERSADGEVWHQSETAGYVVFGEDGTIYA